MRAEDPVAKIHACSTNSSAKSNRFILQFPTVTPMSTVCDCLSTSYRPGFFKFFRGDYISYCTTVRGPDIMRNVIFGYVTFYQIATFFLNIFFSSLAKCVLRRVKWLRRSDSARGPQCGEPWYRLWRGVATARTIVGVQHQLWTVVS